MHTLICLSTNSHTSSILQAVLYGDSYSIVLQVKAESHRNLLEPMIGKVIPYTNVINLSKFLIPEKTEGIQSLYARHSSKDEFTVEIALSVSDYLHIDHAAEQLYINEELGLNLNLINRISVTGDFGIMITTDVMTILANKLQFGSQTLHN